MKLSDPLSKQNIERSALSRGLLVSVLAMLIVAMLLSLRYQSAVKTLETAFAADAFEHAELLTLVFALDRKSHEKKAVRTSAFQAFLKNRPEVGAAYLVDRSQNITLQAYVAESQLKLPDPLLWPAKNSAAAVSDRSHWLVYFSSASLPPEQGLVLWFSDTDFTRRLGQIRVGFGYVSSAAVFGSLFFGLGCYLLKKRSLMQARMKEQLEYARDASEKASSVASLAAVIAHEFSQHLTIISGHLDLAALGASHMVSAELESAHTAVAVASDGIEQLRAIAGTRFNTLRPHRLMEIAEQACTRLRRRGVLSNPTPVTSDDPQTSALCDEAKSSTAVAQLLRNALEAGGSASMRIMQAFESSDKYRSVFNQSAQLTGSAIIVRNPGTISPDVAEQLGKPFFTTKGGGRGLGLSVIQGVLKTSGGALLWRNHDGATEFVLLFDKNPRGSASGTRYSNPITPLSDR